MEMKTNFTKAAEKSVGEIPFTPTQDNYNYAKEAIDIVEAAGVNKERSHKELDKVYHALRGVSKGSRRWLCREGSKELKLAGAEVTESLVPYALRGRLGKIYKIRYPDLQDFVYILHCWRQHGIVLEELCGELTKCGNIRQALAFEDFDRAIQKFWVEGPEKELTFLDDEGIATSIYGTSIGYTSGKLESDLKKAMELTKYETLSCHIISSLLKVSDVALLGLTSDSIYLLDKGGALAKQMEVMSEIEFPGMYFAYNIKLVGEVTKIEDSLF